MFADNINYYIGRESKLKEWDCITLIKKYYWREGKHCIKLPEYSNFNDIYTYTIDDLDKITKQQFNKISLDNAKSKDIVVFKCKNSDKLFHFGIFFMPHYILHIEKDGISTREPISDRYRERIYTLLRVKDGF